VQTVVAVTRATAGHSAADQLSPASLLPLADGSTQPCITPMSVCTAPQMGGAAAAHGTAILRLAVEPAVASGAGGLAACVLVEL
jgi:hypothetical protein